MAASATSADEYIAPTADDEERELIAATASFAADAMRVTGTPGLSLALGRKGRVVWEAAFGTADVAHNQPMTTQTTWPVGSFAKIYVATAALQLVEDGVLDLYGPMGYHVPELQLLNPLGGREITLHDLLTHRSGLGVGTAHWELASGKSLAEHLIDVFRGGRRPEYNVGRPLWTARVGERYQYSSLGIATVGYLVERTNRAELSFRDYVDQRIAKPLGFKSTAFRGSADNDDDPSDLVARTCTGYMAFGRVLVPTPVLESADSPAAALLTTPGDQAELMLAFLNGGCLNGYHLVSQATARMMTTPQTDMDDPERPSDESWAAGLGFEIANAGTENCQYGHGGSQPWGWRENSVAVPHQDLAIVVCTNRWDMTRWFSPYAELASGLLTTFITQWLKGDGGARSRVASEHQWAWTASYMMGIMMVERIHMLLAASGSVSTETIARLASEACVQRVNEEELWAPDAFRAGAEAILGVERTPSAIREFLTSGAGAVTAADLPLLGLWFGRRARLPVPHPGFAGDDAG